jgi:steroid delta-isomerase-like uncharacterized protein
MPRDVSRAEIFQLVARYVAGWNAHDVNEVACLFAPDGSYGEFGWGKVMRGVQEIRGYLSTMFGAVPDLTMTLTDAPICSRQRVLWKWIMRGTLQGRLAGLPPTGERFEVRGVTALVTTENKVVRAADYFTARDIAGPPGREEDRSAKSIDVHPGDRWTKLFPPDEDNIAYGE